ncbi:MAG: lipase family protein [Deltaproteobacteria bacterium]|nr:MAG: lipase family protein [Deltaproteobacteria bacterium]
MKSSVAFNPRLRETAEKLDPAKRNLIMAFLPSLGAPLSGPDVNEKTYELVAAGLEFFQPLIGPWKLVWGPGVFQVVPGAIPANTMFVAEHEETGELFVSIAGTNPFSAYAWFVEDFEVSETRAWGYGSAPGIAALSTGTLKGLLALQGMVPRTGIPGANVTLENFLAERFAAEGNPVEMTVSGHSLGGALSPTLALWLLDTQMQWDPHNRATISVYAFAGPTPGNDAFASYFDTRFGNRVHRVANPLDVVTHAWNVGDLANVKALYTPEIPRDALWDKAADFAIAATNGIRYRQIDPSPVLLDGKVKADLVWRWGPPLLNLAAQVLYQHTLAYFELMDLEYPEERSGLGRHLAQQTDAFAKEILSRAGLVAPLARVLAAGLRLFTEVYSRTPFVPSPLPQMSLPNHR